MYSLANRLGVAALVIGAVIGAVCGPASCVQAQVKMAPSPQTIFPVNTNPLIAPGVSLKQFAYNTAAVGRLYSQIPPYLLGYNQTARGGVYNPNTFAPAPYTSGNGGYPSTGGYSGGYSGGSQGGYSGGYGGGSGGGYSQGSIDPLTGQPTYGGGYSSGGSNPYSSGYYGDSSELQGIAQLGISQEKARILREKALQANLDTRKKLADTLVYIRANQYTFTQEQADIAKRLLQRLQVTPTATEVVSGKSLNMILQALSKFSGKQLRSQTVTLDEDLLKLLNVTGSNGNLGLLRNDGQIPWTTVFDNTTVLPNKQREDIDNYAKVLLEQAANNAGGKLDGNVLKNLEMAVANLRDRLSKNVNTVGAQNYLEGLRFLDDLDGAVRALRMGDAVLYLDFNQKFAKGGKTVAELVDYMSKNGLTFAPALPGDERVYHALQVALSAQSVGLQTAVAAAGNQ
jgi:hypothetical protein